MYEYTQNAGFFQEIPIKSISVKKKEKITEIKILKIQNIPYFFENKKKSFILEENSFYITF